MKLEPTEARYGAGLTLPTSCAVAFKEWAGVCDALMTGRQSLILRKGGVAETSGEFRPDYPAFWLYPTIVHQAEQGLRTPTPPLLYDPRFVSIEALAVVEWTGRVDRLDQLAALSDWHDWTESTIQGRFQYRKPGLWALVVRVYLRGEAIPVAVTTKQLGCKTWVPLESAIPTEGVRGVVEDVESTRRLSLIRQALGWGGAA